MKEFNVINFNINANRFEKYDILQYFTNRYNSCKDKPKTFNDFKEFIEKEAMHQFWSRCEYEIILVDWPCKKIEEKWDVYDQIMMNLDVITSLLMSEVKK